MPEEVRIARRRQRATGLPEILPVPAIEGVVNIWVGEVPVKAVYLIRSELRPTGAEYTDLAEVKIKA